MFLDLSKVFDTIDHSILLYKLSFYGQDNSTVLLLEIYLSNRRQYVEVPQELILGPLLLTIYINNFPKCLIYLTSLCTHMI